MELRDELKELISQHTQASATKYRTINTARDTFVTYAEDMSLTVVKACPVKVGDFVVVGKDSNRHHTPCMGAALKVSRISIIEGEGGSRFINSKDRTSLIKLTGVLKKADGTYGTRVGTAFLHHCTLIAKE